MYRTIVIQHWKVTFLILASSSVDYPGGAKSTSEWVSFHTGRAKTNRFLWLNSTTALPGLMAHTLREQGNRGLYDPL